MTPTPKAPAIEDLLTNLVGISRQDAAKQNICAFCKGRADTFKDELSRRENRISGLCQTCQDDVFNIGG